LFYSPVDFTDASDMHHSNACLMHRWINRWTKQRSLCHIGCWLVFSCVHTKISPTCYSSTSCQKYKRNESHI